MLISYVKLDHTLYSINYGNYVLMIAHNYVLLCSATMHVYT